jgi:hypothetical protein
MPCGNPPGCATACGLAHSRSSGRDGGGLRPPCATAAVVSGDARCGNSTKLGATPSRSSNPMPAVAAGPGVALVQRQVCQRRRPTTRHSLPRSRWELAASRCVLPAPGMLHAADPPATTTNSRASARSPAVSPMAAQAEMLPPPSCVRGPRCQPRRDWEAEPPRRIAVGQACAASCCCSEGACRALRGSCPPHLQHEGAESPTGLVVAKTGHAHALKHRRDGRLRWQLI